MCWWFLSPTPPPILRAVVTENDPIVGMIAADGRNQSLEATTKSAFPRRGSPLRRLPGVPQHAHAAAFEGAREARALIAKSAGTQIDTMTTKTQSIAERRETVAQAAEIRLQANKMRGKPRAANAAGTAAASA